MPKRLADLVRSVGIDPPPAWADVEVTGLCHDSRRVQPGELFAAIPGHARDGLSYAAEAVQRGACAVLAEQEVALPIPVVITPSVRAALARLSAAFYDHPTRDLFTVGVTGTNGKTTTCHWTADVLGAAESVVLSTVVNPTSGLSLLTTPTSPLIQRVARQAVESGAKHLVLEASSAGIEQDRVTDVAFAAAVLTNISVEHTRHHGGFEAYRRAKRKLFEQLNAGAWAIVNRDDAWHREMEDATRARVLSYGRGPAADVRAIAPRAADGSIEFQLRAPDGHREMVQLPFPGAYNVSNALAAAAVGLIHGLSLATVAERLAHVRPVPGRGERLVHADGRVALVDFAHNPAALAAVLEWLRPSYARILVVLGSPGDGEIERRQSMGVVCAQSADALFLTTDNPKWEDPERIADGIRAGLHGSMPLTTFIQDRRDAIRLAVAEAKPGDVVLLAGKGHETVQLVRGERVPHSDIAVLRELGFSSDV